MCAAGFALLLDARAATPEPRDVHLIPSAAGAVRFVVEVPEARVANAEAPQSLPIAIDGYEPRAGSGAVPLPERILDVAVPATGAVRVFAAASAPEMRSGVAVAGGFDARGRDARAAGDETTPGASHAAVLLGVSWLRNQRVAQVAIHPVDYDARGQRATIHHRIEVQVDVEPGPAAASVAESPDPFEGVYQAALVNYEQGKPWRRATARAVGATRAASLAAVTPVAPPDTSIYVGRKWVKIAISAPGFYKVGFDQLRRSQLFNGDTTVALDSLRLFTWPGVPVLPEDSYCDSCTIAEVAMAFVENGNGMFSNNREYFYFYAQGPSGWANEYDASQPDTVYVDHPYETRNYYYLTVATTDQPMPGPPLHIVTRSGALGDTTGATVPATFPARFHMEEDHEYQPDATPIQRFNTDGSYRRSTLFWEKNFWTTLNRGQGFRTPAEPPGIDPTQPARIRLRLWGLPPNPALPTDPTVKSLGIFDHYVDVALGPVLFPRRGWNGNGADFVSGLHSAQTFDSTVAGLPATGNQLRVDVVDFVDPDAARAPLRVDRVGVAWCDLFYARRFEPILDQLDFESPPTSGDDLYRIGPFDIGPDLPRVFDVTEPLRPLEVVGLDFRELSPGAWQLRFRPVEPGHRRYRVIADGPSVSGIVRPANADVVDAPTSSLDNLRSATRRANYLVIYYDGFKAAADSLMEWRKERLPLAGKDPPYDVMGVPISALYDQFSGGRVDPSAIRNFLRAAFYNWSEKPGFVTFLGDASFDFKNIKGLAPAGLPGTLLPSYEGGFDLTVLRQFCTDDWLLNVDAPTLIVPDFLGGRIPAHDAQGALAYVRKLLAYERSAPLGDWRDRVMLIADDNQQGRYPDALGWDHLLYTIELDTLGLPPRIDRTYIYLHRYPSPGGDNAKPGARADLLDQVNRGTVLFNYIGHGSPFKISDESVMIDSDADLLVNATRPSVFVAASCDVGKFNDPAVVGLGERLILNPKGGCVGVISATELASSRQNASLNLTLFQQLFRLDPTTGQFFQTLSQALLAAKGGSTNSQKYQLLGDAGTRLNVPRQFVEVALEDTNGNPVTAAARGQVIQVRGQVVNRPGGSLVAMDGSASLLIEDDAPLDSIPDCTCPPYPYRAAPMFRGDWALSGGRFSGRFLVPMDAAKGPRGRVRAYVAGDDGDDGAGSSAVTVTAGAPPADDHAGPRITLSFPGGGRAVRPDAVLRVDLSDPSGILITGHTPRNGIVVTVDENLAERREITSSFHYAEDSYQSGTALYPLGGLPAGPHRVRVSASDNLAVGIGAAQHRSEATLDFEVAENPPLRIMRAFLFPNPITSRGAGAGGNFIIDAPGDSVNTLVRIYTVAGRLVRTLERFGSLGQAQVPWDGRDDEGAPLANGVYLFQVLVNPRAADESSSGRQKAGAEGRFVVVNR